MKYDFVVKTDFSVDIDFKQIYEYIESSSENSDDQEIYYDFIDNIYYYLEVLYSIVIQELEENEYVIGDIMDDWYDWLVNNKGFSE